MATHTNLRELQLYLRQLVTDDFAESSDHPYACRCDKCREWWKAMGNDMGGYGPFDKEELDFIPPHPCN